MTPAGRSGGKWSRGCRPIMCPTRHGERVLAAMEGGSVHKRTTKSQLRIYNVSYYKKTTIQLNNTINQRNMKLEGSIPRTVSSWLEQKTRPSPGSNPWNLAEAQAKPGRSPDSTRPKPEYRKTDIGKRFLLAEAKDGPSPRSDRQTWPQPKLSLAEAPVLLGQSPSVKVPIPGTVSPSRSSKQTSPEIGPANLAEAQVTTGRSPGSTRPKPEYQEADIGNGLSLAETEVGTFPEICPTNLAGA